MTVVDGDDADDDDDHDDAAAHDDGNGDDGDNDDDDNDDAADGDHDDGDGDGGGFDYCCDNDGDKGTPGNERAPSTEDRQARAAAAPERCQDSETRRSRGARRSPAIGQC